VDPSSIERTVSTVADRLSVAGCVAAREEAEELVAASDDASALESCVRRREHGEPLAWITGAMEFCGRVLAVDPGVYVPRRQSEALAYRAGMILAGLGRRGLAADLCTGTGAIAVQLQTVAPDIAVIGVDLDPRAAACARRNGIPTVIGDLGRPLRSRSFDVLTAVAPYVPTASLTYLPADVQRFEPRFALDGGEDGLEVVRRIVDDAARLLRLGGWLLVEVGGEQDVELESTLDTAGFSDVTTWADVDGDLRGLAARLVRPSAARLV
jgi:release factor glutamine methyltransferase